MRFAIPFAALLIAFSLLLAGCAGSGGAPSNGLAPQGNASNASAKEPTYPSAQPGGAPGLPQGNASPAATGNAPRPAYVNYCYPTYWKGGLRGTGHSEYGYDRCGNYDYGTEISVLFTMPYDLAAYLSGKDFNFNDCPGVPAGAANGSRDISIDGSFRSERNITSQVTGIVDRNPDRETTSSGAMYISQPYGLVFASFPRQNASGSGGTYPHLVVSRCTWGGNVQIQGYDEAAILGAGAGGFSFSSDMREVSGKWAMNGTVAGTYVLERTN